MPDAKTAGKQTIARAAVLAKRADQGQTDQGHTHQGKGGKPPSRKKAPARRSRANDGRDRSRPTRMAKTLTAGVKDAVKAEPSQRPTRKTVKKRPPPRTTAVLSHVLKTLYGELDKLERQEGNKSQDRERASRSLSQHATTLERAVRMQREMAKAKKEQGVSANDKEMLTHAEDLRRVIAERIQKLKSERDNST